MKFKSKYSLLIILLGVILAIPGCHTKKKRNPLEKYLAERSSGDRLTDIIMFNTVYNLALAREYFTYAHYLDQLRQYDDSQVFKAKAKAILANQEVDLSGPFDVDIPADRIAELEKSHGVLLKQLMNGAQKERPSMVARATALYECLRFALKTGDNWNADRCKSELDTQLLRLTGQQVIAQTPANLQLDEKVRNIYFAPDSSKLSKADDNKLAAVAKLAKQYPKIKILLNSYTDHSGSENYNMGLSKLRAAAVKKKLISLGLDAKRIEFYAYGSYDSNVESGNQRRVEIVLE
jgi:outer membrane protein OmpA-like peptidoglycan-associated protein